MERVQVRLKEIRKPLFGKSFIRIDFIWPNGSVMSSAMAEGDTNAICPTSRESMEESTKWLEERYEWKR